MPRGGPRPNSGGARPGAGRPKASVVAYQASRRDQLQALVTDKDWEAIVMRAVNDAKNGDYVARTWLTPYVAGKVPDELTLHASHQIEIIYSDANSADPALPAPTPFRAAADHQRVNEIQRGLPGA
jgi:hypothetical protein